MIFLPLYNANKYASAPTVSNPMIHFIYLGNLLIEKAKVAMITEDISAMAEIIK